VKERENKAQKKSTQYCCYNSFDRNYSAFWNVFTFISLFPPTLETVFGKSALSPFLPSYFAVRCEQDAQLERE